MLLVLQHNSPLQHGIPHNRAQSFRSCEKGEIWAMLLDESQHLEQRSLTWIAMYLEPVLVTPSQMDKGINFLLNIRYLPW